MTGKILISLDDEKYIATTKAVENNVELIPEMTSNTLPYGVASSSYANSSAFQVFDSTNNSWLVNSYTLKNQWVQYEFEERVEIGYVYLSSVAGNYKTFGVEDFEIWVGENSDSLMKVYENKHPKTGDEVRYSLGKNYKAKVFRLLVIDAHMPQYSSDRKINVKRIRLTNDTKSSLVEVLSSSEQDFINHGMDKPFELDMSTEMSTKTFVKQTPITLGSGKVFRKSIDTSQVPIKKVSIK